MGGVQKLRKKTKWVNWNLDFNDCHLSSGLDDFKSSTNISWTIFGYTIILETALRF